MPINPAKLLLKQGKTALLICDIQTTFSAVTFEFDKIVANTVKLRIKEIGCVLSTTESAILKLVANAHHPQFKNIRDIVRPLTGPMGMRIKNIGCEPATSENVTLKLIGGSVHAQA